MNRGAPVEWIGSQWSASFGNPAAYRELDGSA